MSSFDYSSAGELKADIDNNYHFMAKILRQVIAKPTRRLLEKRMALKTFEPLNQWLNQGKSIVVAMGHVGNWEWASMYLGMQYPGNVCALYKKIKSKPVNKWMLGRRLSVEGHLVEIGKISELLRLMKIKPLIILMIADQNPGNDQGIIWTDFLKKATAFSGGPETLASKFKLPVVYLRNTSRNDGGYELEFELISDGKNAAVPGEITGLFAKALERNIQAQRSEWLWSHKRWKRKRE